MSCRQNKIFADQSSATKPFQITSTGSISKQCLLNNVYFVIIKLTDQYLENRAKRDEEGTIDSSGASAKAQSPNIESLKRRIKCNIEWNRTR